MDHADARVQGWGACRIMPAPWYVWEWWITDLRLYRGGGAYLGSWKGKALGSSNNQKWKHGKWIWPILSSFQQILKNKWPQLDPESSTIRVPSQKKQSHKYMFLIRWGLWLKVPGTYSCWLSVSVKILTLYDAIHLSTVSRLQSIEGYTHNPA